jgi:hypothetical protein
MTARGRGAAAVLPGAAGGRAVILGISILHKEGAKGEVREAWFCAKNNTPFTFYGIQGTARGTTNAVIWVRFTLFWNYKAGIIRLLQNQKPLANTGFTRDF